MCEVPEPWYFVTHLPRDEEHGPVVLDALDGLLVLLVKLGECLGAQNEIAGRIK